MLHFDALTMNTAELVLQWQNYRVAVPIKVNEYEKILASIDQELSGSSSFDYFQAALYLLIVQHPELERDTYLERNVHIVPTKLETLAAIYSSVQRREYNMASLQSRG